MQRFWVFSGLLCCFVKLNVAYQYFSCNITYQTLCQSVLAHFQYGSVRNNMAAEPLLRSWWAKRGIDPSGSEDTVMSPLHLSVILSASNDVAVRPGKSRPVWCCFVSNVQLLLQQSVPATRLNPVFRWCFVKIYISVAYSLIRMFMCL